jgi:hypothetical protein
MAAATYRAYQAVGEASWSLSTVPSRSLRPAWFASLSKRAGSVIPTH